MSKLEFHVEGGKNLILDGQKLRTLDHEVADKISNEYPKLTSLSLNLLKLKEIKHWPKLENCVSLSLRDNRLSLENVPLSALETAMPSLKRLDVGGNRLHADPEKFAESIAPLKNLQVIDILGLEVNTAKELARICFVKCSPNLNRVAGVNRDGKVEDSDVEEEDYDDDYESYGLNSLVGEEEISSDSADFTPEGEEEDDDDDDDEEMDDQNEEDENDSDDEHPPSTDDKHHSSDDKHPSSDNKRNRHPSSDNNINKKSKAE